MDAFRIVFAIILPPLAVFLETGRFGRDFWINLALTVLAWLPGVAHALWIVLRARRAAPAGA